MEVREERRKDATLNFKISWDISYFSRPKLIVSACSKSPSPDSMLLILLLVLERKETLYDIDLRGKGFALTLFSSIEK